MKTYRYSPIQKIFKKIYRKINPVPSSPWTKGYVEDICAVNLVPQETLKTFFGDCLDRLQIIKGDDVGDYVEFGVFNGSSLGSMYLTAKKRGLDTMRFFAFDAFQGLPENAEKEDDGVWEKGFYACSFEKCRECLLKRNVDVKEINWVKGWYDQTLVSETAKEHNIRNIGIVFVDCDTYSSSKAVFDFLAPLLKKPAIICLDDWKLNNLDIKGLGEYKSFNEFLEENPHLIAEEIPSYNRKSRSFIIKPEFK